MAHDHCKLDGCVLAPSSQVIFKHIFSISVLIEKYFLHPPVGEIQISRVAQKIINIYNDCILDNKTKQQ